MNIRVDCARSDIGGHGHQACTQNEHFPQQEQTAHEWEVKQAVLVQARI